MQKILLLTGKHYIVSYHDHSFNMHENLEKPQYGESQINHHSNYQLFSCRNTFNPSLSDTVKIIIFWYLEY